MISKIIGFVKKHSNISVFILFFGIVSNFFIEKGISNLDELWNFNFAINIANGLVPYKDFNMLQTPLLPMIIGTIFKIFGQELLLMRFLGIILITGILFTTYKIFIRLEVQPSFSIISVGFIFYLFKNCLFIDYNYFVLFILLNIMYFELKLLNKYNEILIFNLKYDFIIGIMAGMCILTKQSTGFLISLVACSYKIIQVRNINDLKTFFKIFFLRAIGICLPIIILLIYLLINCAISEFIDYTILGIKTFSNKIPYKNLIYNEKRIAVLSILSPIFLVCAFIYLLISKNKIINTFLFYAVASLIVIYPIADDVHFLIGILPTLIIFVYFIYCTLNKIFKNDKMHNKLTIILSEILREFIIYVLIYISFTSLIESLENIKNGIWTNALLHYRNIYMDESTIDSIKNVGDYILSQNDDAYILDATAVFYMIPIDKYYKDFNLFLKGNLGSRGEEGIIEKIKNMNSSSKFLILKDDYGRNWQTPEDVISYIKDNYEKIDEVECFDIYQK